MLASRMNGLSGNALHTAVVAEEPLAQTSTQVLLAEAHAYLRGEEAPVISSEVESIYAARAVQVAAVGPGIIVTKLGVTQKPTHIVQFGEERGDCLGGPTGQQSRFPLLTRA